MSGLGLAVECVGQLFVRLANVIGHGLRGLFQRDDDRVRAIARDEIGTALSVAMRGDEESVRQWWADAARSAAASGFSDQEAMLKLADRLEQDGGDLVSAKVTRFQRLHNVIARLFGDREVVVRYVEVREPIEYKVFHDETPSAARAVTRYGTGAATPCRDGGCSVGETPDTNTAASQLVSGTRESGPVEPPEAPGPDSPPPAVSDRYKGLAITVNGYLPPHCEGLRFSTIAGVLQAADKAGYLMPSVGGDEFGAFQRYTEVIAGLLPAEFTGNWSMGWDQRVATVKAVFDAVSAFYEAHLDGRIS